MPKSTPRFMERGVETCRLVDFPVVASGQLPQPFQEWSGEANDQMLFLNLYRKAKITSDVYRTFFGLGPPLSEDGTSSWESQRPPDVTCGAAILIPRWRRRKWRQPRPGAAFSTPIAVAVENGGPSSSGRHLGWPHLRNRKWGHPRWRPEAEGPPFSTATGIGIEKAALYYSHLQYVYRWLYMNIASYVL